MGAYHRKMGEQGRLTTGPGAEATRNGPGLDHAVVWLQLLGVGWIAINQFRNHLGLDLGQQSGLVAKGYLGAGLFFMAGGFALFRRYTAAPFGFDRGHLRVLWDRLASDYPLHLLVLAGMVAGLAGARTFGAPVHSESFRPGDLPAQLLLLQGWGFVRGDSWNFPTWLVSADWFALLVFPLVGLSVRKATPAVVVMLSSLLFGAAFIFFESQGVLFSDMTSQAGILQAIPAYFLGAALARVASTWRPEPIVAPMMLLLSAIGIVVGSATRISDLWIWPMFGPLVLGAGVLGEDASSRHQALASGLAAGAVTLQLTYLPSDIVYFRILRSLGEVDPWLALAGAALSTGATAALAHHVVQMPVGTWLRRRNPLRTLG